MDEKEQYRIIILTYIVGIGINFAIDLLVKNLPFTGSFFSFLKITTILTLWWWFYFYFGWRLPCLCRLLYRKNYNGTWFGTYTSLSHTKEETSGNIAIRIHQTWLSLGIISMTEQYENFSYAELAKNDLKSNTFGISYTYSQRENNLFDVAQRNGTAELTFKLINDESWLEGHFWTIHGTNGTVNVKRISTEQIDSFSEASQMASEVVK